jgi:DNA-binding transcriptional LysR family regulator
MRDWNIAFYVSEFLELPMVVASTDLVSLMPVSMASRIEATGLLRMLPFPATLPPLAVNMVWHTGRRRDPGHMWLRKLVRDEVRRFASEAIAAV